VWLPSYVFFPTFGPPPLSPPFLTPFSSFSSLSYLRSLILQPSQLHFHRYFLTPTRRFSPLCVKYSQVSPRWFLVPPRVSSLDLSLLLSRRADERGISRFFVPPFIHSPQPFLIGFYASTTTLFPRCILERLFFISFSRSLLLQTTRRQLIFYEI